ncbi:uncharacterized protein [Diadema setosum]|uniref:uncharacterized protein n=1 Tax=Diadema setosum TaxID=31175 RepID=UPI003B3B0A94
MAQDQGMYASEAEVSMSSTVSDMPVCDDLGIREDVLEGIANERPIEWTKLNGVLLVNGVVLELWKWVKRRKYHANIICSLIQALFDVEIAKEDNPGIRRKVERLVDEDRRLRKNKRARGVETLRVFLRTLFRFEGGRRARVRDGEREEGEREQGEEEGQGTGEVEGVEIEGERGRAGGAGGEERVGPPVEERMRGKRRRETIEGEIGISQGEREKRRRETVGGRGSVKLDEALQEIERLRWELNVVKSRYISERRKCQRFQRELKDLMKRLQSQKKTAAELRDSCERAARDASMYLKTKRARENEISTLKQKLAECRLAIQGQAGSGSTSATSHDGSVREEALEQCRVELRDARVTLERMEEKLAGEREMHLAEREKVERERSKFQRRIKVMKKWRKRMQRRERYRVQGERRKREKMHGKMRAKDSKISSMTKEVRQLREELKAAQSLNAREKEHVAFKEQGLYDTRVRAVYQDLLAKYSVSTRNCEGVVRTVLGGLTDLDVENIKLPKKTTATEMLYEGRKLSQIQVARVLQEEENTTLSSDATTKFGHHYSAFDIYKGSDGGSSSMMIGMGESVGGTAQTTLDTLLGLLHEISDMPGSTQGVNKIIRNIKNTMSDRHVAEKKFNELLKEYRQNILPEIVDGWEEMNSDEKEQFKSMNNFFCGLHYVVGLADYASKTIQAWEKMIFGDDRVGAESLSGMHVESGECGTVRLVRTICKSVQDRGCERSGKPVEFRSFLKSKGVEHVPLAPFHGNRFNILFHNGAGVYFLLSHLKEFFAEHAKDNNLLRAVDADLHVTQYLAATRALGLIDKLVTAPLWRVINEAGHIVDMSAHYSNLHACFVNWANDATQFMRGEAVAFEGKHNPDDPIFMSLVTPNAELDEMTKQILELVFLTFCQVTESMLMDHLGSGKYAEMGEERKRETESVPKTNVGVERDFGMLDRLMRLKPSASMLVYEGIIMGVKNKTSEWRKGLAVTEREELMEYARRSVKAQKEEYAKRAKRLWEERTEKRKSKQQQAEEREVKKRVKSEKVYADAVAKCGGIWLSEREVDEKMQGASEKTCVEMLQAQLQARRHVFQEKNVKGRLNLSEKGRKKSMEELKESVLEIIRESNERGERVENEQEADYAFVCASEEKIGEYKRKVEEKRRKAESRGKKERLKGSEMKYENLVGKIVDHLTVAEDGDEGWYRATVISKCRKGLRLIYDSEPQTAYEYTRREIEEDFQNGDMKLAEFVIEDIIGRNIMHRFEVDGELVWFRGVISSLRREQECLVIYEEMEDEEGELENSWVGPILEDYENNDVRFLARP